MNYLAHNSPMLGRYGVGEFSAGKGLFKRAAPRMAAGASGEVGFKVISPTAPQITPQAAAQPQPQIFINMPAFSPLTAAPEMAPATAPYSGAALKSPAFELPAESAPAPAESAAPKAQTISDIMTAQKAAESKGAGYLPLIIGAGILIYFLMKGKK